MQTPSSPGFKPTIREADPQNGAGQFAGESSAWLVAEWIAQTPDPWDALHAMRERVKEPL